MKNTLSKSDKIIQGLDGFDAPIPINSHGDTEKTSKSKSGIYDFQPEPSHILNSSLKNNPMSGITFFYLISLLFVKRKSIDWWRYKHRILALIFMGIFNSFLSLIEYIYIAILMCIPKTRALIYKAQIDKQAPLFVLGHPRTGTTLLHSLLALDEERFTFCDTFMVGFPHCFLCFEKIGKFLFSGILSKTRPMDNMKLHFDLPQEDELGTNLLSGFLVSPYSSIAFMREEKEFRKYQCFGKEASPSDIKKWCDCFCYLTTKIKIRDLLMYSSSSTSHPRRLLLKSPCHTGRARLLLKLFPDARFIFIHRNPYELFLSGAHMASTTYGYWFLQEPSNLDLQEYILAQGSLLHDEYFSCRDDGLLHEGNCAEVSFEALTKDPMNTIHQIYSQLQFDSFSKTSGSLYPQRLLQECKKLTGYKRNQFQRSLLDAELTHNIETRWANQFKRLNYDTNLANISTTS